MAETTSPSLLLRIRNADDLNAWDEFVEIYTPIVRSYCLQRRIQQADVDDIVQDVMSSIAKSIRRFDYDPNKGRFRGWFGTITANRIKTFLAQKSKQNTSGPMSPPEASYVDPDSDWVAIFSERILSVACSKIRGDFADQTWECFEATWVRNEPAAQVAETVGIPVHSVYVNKSRVLKRLENEVKLLADDMAYPGMTN